MLKTPGVDYMCKDRGTKRLKKKESGSNVEIRVWTGLIFLWRLSDITYIDSLLNPSS